MTRTVHAIYESGVFRPIEATDIQEGEHVTLVVETHKPESPDPIGLALRVYADLSEGERAAVEQIALDRSGFFCDELRDEANRP